MSGAPEDQRLVLGLGREAVHEVVGRVSRAAALGPEAAVRRPLHLAPPDVRQLAVGAQPAHRPGQDADACDARALLALGEEQLEPHAEAQDGDALVGRAQHRPVEPVLADAPHRLAEVADPREHNGVGAGHVAGVPGDADVRPQLLPQTGRRLDGPRVETEARFPLPDRQRYVRPVCADALVVVLLA